MLGNIIFKDIRECVNTNDILVLQRIIYHT